MLLLSHFVVFLLALGCIPDVTKAQGRTERPNMQIDSLHKGIWVIFKKAADSIKNAVGTLQDCLTQFGRLISKSFGELAEDLVATQIVLPGQIARFIIKSIPGALGGEFIRNLHKKLDICVSENDKEGLIKETVQTSLKCIGGPTIGNPLNRIYGITDAIDDEITFLPQNIKKIGDSECFSDLIGNCLIFVKDRALCGIGIGLKVGGAALSLGLGMPSAGFCIATKVAIKEPLEVLGEIFNIAKCFVS